MALVLSACGGSEDGDEGAGQPLPGGGEAPSDEGSFAIYDWEPNVVAPPGVSDATNTQVGKAQAERFAAKKAGTIVLRAPAPVDIPQTKFDETEGVTRKYYVLRDRPALDESDVEDAYVQVDPTTHQPSIIVGLTPEGKRKYENLTFREAKRGETLSSGPIQVSIGPRHAVVVGHEILSIPQLGAGTYTHGIRTSVITVVGGFDKAHAEELADSIHPG